MHSESSPSHKENNVQQHTKAAICGAIFRTHEGLKMAVVRIMVHQNSPVPPELGNGFHGNH